MSNLPSRGRVLDAVSLAGGTSADRRYGIQRHGVAIVVDPRALRVLDASDNAADVLGIPEPTGSPLRTLFAPEAFERIERRLHRAAGSALLPDLATTEGVAVDAVARASEKGWLFELEPRAGALRLATTELDASLHEVLERIREADDVDALAETAASQLRELIGFDRVALMRLSDTGADLAAESVEGAPSLLDEPLSLSERAVGQTRALAVMRHVADVEAAPYPLHVDADVVFLRALAPADRGVLEALGVRALLSLPLMVGDQVWGVLVAHHLRAPQRLGLELRNACTIYARAVAARLRELDAPVGDPQRRIAQLESELESAHAQRDEFLSALSHELRTPLNTIVGWTEMLGSGALGQRQSDRAVEAIQRNAAALRRQVDDLLDVSRILRAQMHLDETTVEMEEVVRDVCRQLAPVAEDKLIGLDCRCRAPGYVEGDRERLAQIVWNLVDNAVKFTREGSVTVLADRSGGEVRVRVGDTGPGIATEQLPYVFDRFQQDRGGGRGARRGLGLGLALVRMLTELHGGRVEVESEGEGHGATFTLWFPPTTPSSVVPVQRPANDDEPATLEGVRLLVVEDDPDSAELVAKTLELRGAEVLLAYDAEEALERLSPPPDALISDLDLPGMNGYELLEGMRRSGHELPAIALSAFRSRRHRTRAMEAGFDTFFSKPADTGALVQTIVKMLTSRS